MTGLVPDISMRLARIPPIEIVVRSLAIIATLTQVLVFLLAFPLFTPAFASSTAHTEAVSS